MSTIKENTAMIYIHWNEYTDRYTQYKVPYEIAKAIEKLLEKNQVDEKRDINKYLENNLLR